MFGSLADSPQAPGCESLIRRSPMLIPLRRKERRWKNNKRKIMSVRASAGRVGGGSKKGSEKSDRLAGWCLLLAPRECGPRFSKVV